MKLESSRLIFEKHLNIKFMNIRPMGAEFSHADGLTGGGTYKRT